MLAESIRKYSSKNKASNSHFKITKKGPHAMVNDTKNNDFIPRMTGEEAFGAVYSEVQNHYFWYHVPWHEVLFL